MSTLREALSGAQQALSAMPDSQPELEAALLLCHLLDKPKTYLYAWPEVSLTPGQQQAYLTLVERRLNGTPIAYITERREFWSLSLRVTPATLIPRPETELAVERSLFHLAAHHQPTLADLGTGSGAIALALSSERPEARIDATDCSSQALTIAQENAARLGFQNIDFHLGDWCRALPAARQYDLLVSNPPYVESSDPHLSQGDLPQEPIEALASGSDGLKDIREIIAQASARLKPGGWLVLEHGYQQANRIQELLQSAGLEEISTHRDLAALPRVTEARRRTG
jgi:release factor glutamine methyltransferase